MAGRNTIDARRTRNSALLALLVLLAGCVSMSEQECRSADWYKLGYRDGDSYGLRPQVDAYAAQCSRAGINADEKAYLAGWVDGYREWTSRVMATEHP